MSETIEDRLRRELQELAEQYPATVIATKVQPVPFLSLFGEKFKPDGTITLRILKARADGPPMSEHFTTKNCRIDWDAMRLTGPTSEGVQPELRDTFMREVASSEYQLSLKDAFQCEEGLGDSND